MKFPRFLRFLKSEQLSLFGAPRRPVEHPGIRGGKGYHNEKGQWVYGDRPAPEAPAAPRYDIKCDDCREKMGETDSMRESAAGGRCEKCKAKDAPTPDKFAGMDAWLNESFPHDDDGTLDEMRAEARAAMVAQVEKYPDMVGRLSWKEVHLSAENDERRTRERAEETEREARRVERAGTYEGTAAANAEHDIPMDVAVRAHSGSSFVPERRGVQMRQGYAETIQGDYDALAKYATTPEKRAQLDEEFARYRAGYRQKFMAYAGRRSNVMSAMITGPSNFPVRRNEKRLNAERRGYEDMEEFRKRALHAIRVALTPELQPIKAGEANATDRLKAEIEKLEKTQALYAAINATIRKHAKAGPDAQVPALVALGVQEHTARKLLEKDFAGRIGVAPYLLTNNGANIRRLKARLATVAEDKATDATEIEGEHATFEDDPPGNRVRLKFPGKPPEDVRSKLKHNGFRWAPSNGAWQAYRNPRSIAFAREFAGVPAEPAPAAPPAAPIKFTKGEREHVKNALFLLARGDYGFKVPGIPLDAPEHTQLYAMIDEGRIPPEAMKALRSVVIDDHANADRQREAYRPVYEDAVKGYDPKGETAAEQNVIAFRNRHRRSWEQAGEKIRRYDRLVEKLGGWPEREEEPMAKGGLLIFAKGRFPKPAGERGKVQLGKTKKGKAVWASGAEAHDYDDDDHADAARLHAKASAYHDDRARGHREAADGDGDWRRGETHEADHDRHRKLAEHHFDRTRDHLMAGGHAEEADFDGATVGKRRPLPDARRKKALGDMKKRTHNDHPGGVDDADRGAYGGDDGDTGDED